MPRQGDKLNVVQVPKSRVLVEYMAAAIHYTTLIEDRPAVIRAACVHAAKLIIDDERWLLDSLLRLYGTLDLAGTDTLIVAFTPAEIALLDECKRRLRPLTDLTMTRAQMIQMLLIRLGQPAFGWPKEMTSPTVDPTRWRLHQ